MNVKITGNWIRDWSPKGEAASRVCQMEQLLRRRGYAINPDSPVYYSTNRIILDNRIIENRDNIPKQIYDFASKWNISTLLNTMRNLAPARTRAWRGGSETYEAGSLEFNITSKEEKNPRITLKICALEPKSEVVIENYESDKGQLIYDWGDIRRVIVSIDSNDNQLVRELVKASRAVRNSWTDRKNKR